MNELDVFQRKGLRQILKLKSTYFDRHNTNEHVYNVASVLTSTKQKKVRVSLASDIYAQRRSLSIYSAILSPDSSPTRSIFLQNNSARPILNKKRRGGRPRYLWSTSGLADLWRSSTTRLSPDPDFDPYSDEHGQDLQMAIWIA